MLRGNNRALSCDWLVESLHKGQETVEPLEGNPTIHTAIPAGTSLARRLISLFFRTNVSREPLRPKSFYRNNRLRLRLVVGRFCVTR